MILGHIAGIPVQESLAYVLPVFVIVGWIYWAGRRERRRSAARANAVTSGAEDSPETAPDEHPEPGLVAGPPSAGRTQ